MKPLGYFISSLVFLLILPLAPLGFEAWIDHGVKESSWAIAAAMFSICTGACSRAEFVFSAGIVGSIGSTVMYAVSEANQKSDHPEIPVVSIVILFAFSSALVVERAIRHVIMEERFLEFD
jgi:hypothetical protein